MNPRNAPFIITGISMATIILLLALDLPYWLAVGVGLSVIFLSLLLFMRAMQQNQLRQLADPVLQARAELALSRIGRPDVPAQVVHGNGLPLVDYKQGRLVVSPLAGEILTDEELGAMALSTLSIRPELARRELLRLYGPWVVAMVLAGVVSIYTGFPWIGPVFLVMVVWSQVITRRKATGRQVMEANVQAFLDRGGDAAALLSGLVKVQSALISAGYNQAPVVTQYRGVLETVTRLGGIDPAETQRLMAHLQAPPDLGARGEAKARKQIWLIVAIVLLMAFAMFIPLLLQSFMTGGN